MSYLSLRNVSKTYQSGEVKVKALRDITFDLNEDEFVVILGASGAGKTTLLNLLGGMDTATSGEIEVAGKRIDKLNKRGLTTYRRHDVGFIFQFYNLMPNLTALENVELAVEICSDAISPKKVLESVGLKNRLHNFPSQLSGGEQQRVSIARALAKNPNVLLCDEPTGALDYVTGKQILKLLQDTCRKRKMTVIIITHNSAIAPMADKVIKFKSGKVEEIKINKKPVDIERIEW